MNAADLESMREFAARYTAAWCSQNPAAVAGFFEPRGILAVNQGAPAQGRDEIAGVARSFMTTFPDLVVAMDDVAIQGERFFYHWTLTGTHAETKKPVRISGFEAWRMGDSGLIAVSEGHFDEAAYQRQIQG